MATDLQIKVSQLEYHRNGVCGTGFAVARFTFKSDDRKRVDAIATVFDSEDEINTAVISLDNRGQPDLTQTWRGDRFHDDLRSFIKSAAGQQMMFPHLALSGAAA